MEQSIVTLMSAILHSPENTSRPSLHDAEETSQSLSPHRPSDLEKAVTIEDAPSGNSTGAYRATSGGRISRIQSLTQRRAVFDHPLSHVKTSADFLVDFDGPDGALSFPNHASPFHHLGAGHLFRLLRPVFDFKNILEEKH